MVAGVWCAAVAQVPQGKPVCGIAGVVGGRCVAQRVQGRHAALENRRTVSPRRTGTVNSWSRWVIIVVWSGAPPDHQSRMSILLVGGGGSGEQHPPIQPSTQRAWSSNQTVQTNEQGRLVTTTKRVCAQETRASQRRVPARLHASQPYRSRNRARVARTPFNVVNVVIPLNVSKWRHNGRSSNNRSGRGAREP